MKRPPPRSTLFPYPTLFRSESDFTHRLPGVANISRRARGVPADFRSPLPHLRAPVLAQAVQNWPADFEQCLAHNLVHRLHLLVLVKIPRPAPIVFQIVDSPLRVRLRVLFFVPVASFVSRASIRPRRRIEIGRAHV